MVRTVRFEIGKGQTLDNLNRFLQEHGLRSANILSTSVQSKGRDTLEYILTYEDTTSPYIVSTYPNAGDSNVGLATSVIAIFSESIQALSAADIEIFNVTDNVTVSSALYTIDNSQVGLAQGIVRIADSGDYLAASKIYRVTFQTTIKDTDGNTMQEAYYLTFTTGTTQSGELGDGVVKSGNIASGQVGWPHLASGAVRSGHIGNGAVVSGGVASGHIGWPHLASGAVRSGHIGNAAVVSGSIASGQISWPHLASGSVLSGHIASGQVGPNHLASGITIDISRKIIIRQALAGEAISGGFPVRMASGGLLRPAFADFGLGLNTNPAFGVANEDIASGAMGDVLEHGTLIHPQAYSGSVFSGRLGQKLFVNTQANVATGQPPLTPDPSVITSGGFHQVIGLATSGSQTVAVLPNTEVIGIESL